MIFDKIIYAIAYAKEQHSIVDFKHNYIELSVFPDSFSIDIVKIWELKMNLSEMMIEKITC